MMTKRLHHWVFSAVFMLVIALCSLNVAMADGSLTDNTNVSPRPAVNSKYYYLIIDCKTQVLSVLRKDAGGRYTIVDRQMVCSTGKPAISTVTPVGTFKIYAKKRWMSAPKYGVFAQYASRINGPILIHSVTFTKKNSLKLVRQSYFELGKPASHGCIRLTVRDAKWIYANCPYGTVVKVVKSGGPAKTRLLPVPSLPTNATYDPTDTAIVH